MVSMAACCRDNHDFQIQGLTVTFMELSAQPWHQRTCSTGLETGFNPVLFLLYLISFHSSKITEGRAQMLQVSHLTYPQKSEFERAFSIRQWEGSSNDSPINSFNGSKNIINFYKSKKTGTFW